VKEVVELLENNLRQEFPELNITVGYDNYLNTMPDTVEAIKQNIETITRFFQYAINKFKERSKKFHLVISWAIPANFTIKYDKNKNEVVIELFLNIANITDLDYQAGFALIDIFYDFAKNVIYPILFEIKGQYFKIEAKKSYDLYNFTGDFSKNIFIEKQQTFLNTIKLLNELLSAFPLATKVKIESYSSSDSKLYIALVYEDVLSISYEIKHLNPLQVINIISKATINETSFSYEYPYEYAEIIHDITYFNENIRKFVHSRLVIKTYWRETSPALLNFTFELWQEICQEAFNMLNIDEVVLLIVGDIFKASEIKISDDMPLDETMSTIKSFYYPLRMLKRLEKLLTALKC